MKVFGPQLFLTLTFGVTLTLVVPEGGRVRPADPRGGHGEADVRPPVCQAAHRQGRSGDPQTFHTEKLEPEI